MCSLSYLLSLYYAMNLQKHSHRNIWEPYIKLSLISLCNFVGFHYLQQQLEHSIANPSTPSHQCGNAFIPGVRWKGWNSLYRKNHHRFGKELLNLVRTNNHPLLRQCIIPCGLYICIRDGIGKCWWHAGWHWHDVGGPCCWCLAINSPSAGRFTVGGPMKFISCHSGSQNYLPAPCERARAENQWISGECCWPVYLRVE